MPDLPLFRRFPALSRISRAAFGTYPTPVDRVALSDGRVLLVKRDDLSAPAIGGNKVRGLEWLLADVHPGDRVLTVGPRGSTHALATATHARSRGASTIVVRWNQEMNAVARVVDLRLRAVARVVDARRVGAAYIVASAIRLAGRVKCWIPAGGASAVAMLGHVNAALELVEQVNAGQCECPERIVVPYGTGGTAAGLALGFRIAALPTRVVAVRVVPRLLGRPRRLRQLAASVASLIERTTGEALPRLSHDDILVDHRFYGGGYGRPLIASPPLPPDDATLRALGISLDDTYSRKAFAAAIAQPSRRTMLWLTFDGRLLQD